MARKDVTDEMVCEAYHARATGDKRYPYEILMERTGEPEKVCYAAMERAEDHGLVDCGVSLRTGWLTQAGRELIGVADEPRRHAGPRGHHER